MAFAADWSGWTALAVGTNGKISTEITAGGKYYLNQDLTISGTLTISVGKATSESEADQPVTLDLNGHVLALADAGSAGSGRVIQITETGSLTLQDSDSTALHLFTPDETGRWVLDETNGTRSVSGGVITGGTSGTEVSNGGGVKNEGTFTMTGGQIVGNAAVLSVANMGGYGGGVYSHAGQDTPASFTMSGGRILYNTAVYGGGIHSSGTKNGSAPILATLTVNGSADIYHNHAKNGGGIYAEYTTAALSSSATVSRNTATSCGGGILVQAGSFTMYGGTISGNSVSCADGSGLGGGLYCGSDSFTVSEGASVTDNVVGGTEGTDYQYYGGKDSNVYLRGSMTITVSGTFTGTLGVTTEQTAAAYPSAVTIATSAQSTQAYNFISDNGLYSVEKTHDKGVYVIQFVGKCTHENLTEADGTYTCNNCGKSMVAKLTRGEGDGETTTYYSTFADAILAAQTDGEAATVTLLTSLTDSGKINNSVSVKSGSFTLDLNGHTVEFMSGSHLVITGGSVTLTDSVDSGSSSGNISSIQVKAGGTLTVSGGTVNTLSGNGTVIVGTAAALAAAASGSVSNIRLANDITTTAPLNVTKDLTLDLNGHVLHGTQVKISQDYSLTLVDSGDTAGSISGDVSGRINLSEVKNLSDLQYDIVGGNIFLGTNKTEVVWNPLYSAYTCPRTGHGSADVDGKCTICHLLLCTCTTPCSMDGMNMNCPVCGQEGANSRYCSQIKRSILVEEPKLGDSYQSGGTIEMCWEHMGFADSEKVRVCLINTNDEVVKDYGYFDVTIGGANQIVPADLAPGAHALRIYYNDRASADPSAEYNNYDEVWILLNDGQIVPLDKTVDYRDGLTYDVTKLFFTLNSTVAYSLTGRTGTGSLNDDVLSVTRTGTFEITAVCGESRETATLTVRAPKANISSSSAPTYSVTAPTAANGTVTVNPKNAKKGATVTITVTPDTGYVLETLTITDKNGNAIELTDLGDGKYSFRMPAGKVDVKATFMDDNTMLNFFVDVTADKYYYDAVLWAAKNGITGGVDETHFGPDLSCTRAQLVTFLWRTAGCPVVNYAMDFSDVGDDYYTEAIRWAASLGIVGGYGNGLFGTNDTITREQSVTILYRFTKAMGMDVSVGEDTNILSYNDAFDVSEYAVSAFQWATGAGIVQGADGNLMPKNSCTRAQIVTMLYRLLGE